MSLDDAKSRVGFALRGALLAALSLLPGPGMACELRVQVPSIESFTRVGIDGELEGYAVDTMREALRRIGCRPRFVDLPGARSWDAVAAGELDVLFGVRLRPGRESQAWFLGPLEHVQLALYVRRDAMPARRLRSLEDLRETRLRVGIERLSSYGPEYDALLDDPAFVERLRIVVSREAGIAMLASGRLDAVFADGASARRIGDIDVVRAVELTPVPVHIAVSKTSVGPVRHQALRDALALMASDGTLDRLRAAAEIENRPPTPPEPPADGTEAADATATARPRPDALTE